MKKPLFIVVGRHGLCASVLLGLPLAAFAQVSTSTPPPDAVDALLSPTPRPRPKPKATPDPTLPVGTINGTAIYRPLMKSVVADPIDRALMIGDYNRRLPKLTEGQVEEAVRSYKRSKFNDNDAQLDAKLTQLGGNRDDFKRFVTEETKLRLVLGNVTRGSVSDESAQRAQRAYVAGLRQKASVNQPKPNS